jgi:hypothetical protein
MSEKITSNNLPSVDSQKSDLVETNNPEPILPTDPIKRKTLGMALEIL